MNKITDIYTINKTDDVAIVFDLLDNKGEHKYGLDTLQDTYDHFLKWREAQGHTGALVGIPNLGTLQSFDKDTLLSIRATIDGMLEAL